MSNWLTKKKIILSSILIVFVALIGYTTYLYLNFKSTMEAIHNPIQQEETKNAIASNNAPILEEPQKQDSTTPSPITLLLLGIDQLEDTPGRADTILVLTINPETESMKMLSIPRDTYTEIAGLDFSDKINHSYAFGGMQMAHATVENLLQIPIDYVVTINMEGFKELVDLLDGVEVENEWAFSNWGYDFPEGTITLTGEEALSFVRMRKQDPLGDFGRQIRQRLVVESLLDELSSLNLVWQVPSILDMLREHSETNITFDEIKQFAKYYKPALNNIEQLHFEEGDGRIENGIWYYFPSEKELESIREQLKNSLTVEK
ncbi:LCP family protein [Lysinibacillus telephonicus]|uniref:LytR family transcriptional regulator n=1 Tax=Lysinibacillus telephonicus TaxID=1714840 RepID=A0A3S0JY31_9BACI|nr:LCP family protein [Lysinibacillus telephonicus]RTQ94340.1 LytR family transcriptional regulator [Lysinibacillus telephonicus]